MNKDTKGQSTKGKELGLEEITIPMGIFEFAVVAVRGDYSKMDEYIKWKFDDKDIDIESWNGGYAPRGQVFFRRGYAPVLWIPRRPKTAREYATLAHEAIHCAYHLFRWVNMPLTSDTEEVVAHATAHIVNGVLSFPNERKKV